MPTMFDLLGHPCKSAIEHEETNLSSEQVVALHKAHCLCVLLMEVSNPVADSPIAHSISFDALEGTFWLLRDLIDAAGKPSQGE